MPSPGPGSPVRSAKNQPASQHERERDEPADEQAGQPAQQARRARRCARVTVPGMPTAPAPVRRPGPRGQCRRTSHEPQRGAGRGGNSTSGSPPAASASAASAASWAASSARARCSCERRLVVHAGDDLAGGQVVQLHARAGPAQRAPGADGVERQRRRPPGVVGVRPPARSCSRRPPARGPAASIRSTRPSATIRAVGDRHPALQPDGRGVGSRAGDVLGDPLPGPQAVLARPARRRGSPRCSSAGRPAPPRRPRCGAAAGSSKNARSARCTTAPSVLRARAPTAGGAGRSR